MGLIPALTVFTPGTTIVASQVNSNFNSIRAVVNGGLDDSNISGISASKVSGTLDISQVPAEVFQDRGDLGTRNLNEMGPSDIGVWRQDSDANATSGRNYPVTVGGTFLVLPSMHGVRHVYLPRNSGVVHSRGLTGAWNSSNGPWGSWGNTVTTDASSLTSGTLAAARVPNLSANKITSDTLHVDRIPSLSADKITSGSFNADRIPNLTTGKITSGRFSLGRLPTSTTANRFLKVGTASTDPAYSAIGESDVPNLPASKITSGTFALARIPTLDEGRIPSLNASKIGSGTLSSDRLPATISGNRTFSGAVTFSNRLVLPIY